MKTSSSSDTVLAGECQACFRQFVIHGTNHANYGMVLHGYERPGHGYIVGQCWGVAEQPYELSCEVTKKWKTNLVTKALPQWQATLADLKSGETKTFTVTLESSDYHRRDRTKRLFTVTEGKPLPEGWAETVKLVQENRGYLPYDVNSDGTPNFDRLRKSTIFAVEQTIKEIKGTIELLTSRIKAWKFAPERLTTRDKHLTVDMEIALKARNEKKTAREAKNAAKVVRAAKARETAIADVIAMRAKLAPLLADPAVMARVMAQPWGHWVERNTARGLLTSPLTTDRHGDVVGYSSSLSYLREDLRNCLKWLKDLGIKSK